MSHLDDLIHQLCPTGVEYRPLADLVAYEQPGKYIVESTAYGAEALTPVLTPGQTFILGYTDETGGIYPASKAAPVILFDDFTTACRWIEFPFKVKSSAIKLLTIRPGGSASLRYVYYLLSHSVRQPEDHARQWISQVSQVPRPIPPLKVQQEIVRILDTFTDLEAQLEAELVRRRQQYSHYRSELVESTSSHRIPTVALREVGTWLGGSTPSKGRPEYWENGTIPWVSPKDMRGPVVHETVDHITTTAVNSRVKLVPANSVVMVVRSGILERRLPIAIIPKQAAINQDLKAVVPNKNVDHRWIAHWMNAHSDQILSLARKVGGTVTSLDVSRLLDIQIPVPPLEEQRRIVGILDQFDALVNDLSVGLPAELAARRKQYEHYRDKLLTFKELV